MEFGLSETQQTLKNTVRKFLAAECPVAEVRRLMEIEGNVDPALWKKIAEQGWTGMIFAEPYGGFGMGMVEMAATLEEMGRALLPGPFFSTVLMAGVLVESAGDENQKGKYLGAICRGEAKAGVAFLEESAAMAPESIQMPARTAGSGFVLDGRKLFVQSAPIADFLVVAARLEGELALLVVPAKAGGLQISPMASIDLTRKVYEVSFQGVKVPGEDLLARGEAALKALGRARDVATVGLVAEMTGGMQRLLDMTVEYAKTRQQFGRPIGQFQAVQHHCADMLLYTESARSAAYYAAYAVQEGIPDARLAVSVAKAYASDAYREVGNNAIQVHGGMGFTWENDAHLYYRRAKVSELMFGDATHHREQIARLVIDAKPAADRTEAAATVRVA
ncbi:MAG TPA: acyl-CoA dehydrogenase family protein [Bryobacteraceae bacterium]|nr:acyl-CoA dehydrogenase family protein [Bryobacteraceae bacterium]